MDIWDTKAELLDIYLDSEKLGPTLELRIKLREIIQLQFHPDTISEVHGLARIKKKNQGSSLDLEVLKLADVVRLEEAFRLFGEGDYSGLDILAAYVNNAYESYSTNNILTDDLKTINLLYNFISELIDKDSDGAYKFIDENKDYLVDSLRYIMKSYLRSNVEIEDMATLLANFHCHPNGTEPSPIDVSNNLRIEIPELVISFKEDYEDKGVDIYLVHKGEIKPPYHLLLSNP